MTWIMLYQARLACALTAVACELYLDAYGRWPDKLDDLVPGYLKAIPPDPYVKGPVRLRRYTKFIAVYSVGPDLQDNQGNLRSPDFYNPTKGWDIGFVLWNPQRRPVMSR